MHLLEDHAEVWIGAHGVGFDMMGEQGAESIHARFTIAGQPQWLT